MYGSAPERRISRRRRHRRVRHAREHVTASERRFLSSSSGRLQMTHALMADMAGIPSARQAVPQSETRIARIDETATRHGGVPCGSRAWPLRNELSTRLASATSSPSVRRARLCSPFSIAPRPEATQQRAGPSLQVPQSPTARPGYRITQVEVALLANPPAGVHWTLETLTPSGTSNVTSPTSVCPGTTVKSPLLKLV